MKKQNENPQHCTPSAFRLSNLALSLMALGLTMMALPLQAEDYFNPAALELLSPDAALDLEKFSVSGGQLPGSYRVDIYLNNALVATRNVNFVELDGKLQPEFTPAQLRAMGIKLESFPGFQLLAADKPISGLGHYIPSADSQFDFSQQRLNLSIPQAALSAEARGFVDPAQWDQGLPAALVNYAFSGAKTRRDGSQGPDDNYYLNLRSGLNLGAWRLRNYSTWSDDGGQRQWQNVNSYLQRDVQALKGQLTLGDSTSPGEIFDSVQFRGAQIASDDNMFPDSLKGFAPVVRGIAQSNAQVTVRQNGYIIYQTYVAPGPFAITDLYPTASSGDLDVVITEADGSERHSVQPFSAVPVMLREGRLKYAATAGEYRSVIPDALKPGFAQGTLIYGLPANTTLYGGLLVSDRYNAQVVGLGHGFGDLGSLSVDVTQAKTGLRDGRNHSGQSFRFQYAKDIEVTKTTFTLAGYRYSTSGFYDFKEANELGASSPDDWRQRSNKRSKAQVNINQSLEQYGNFYLSASQQDYWRESGYERNISAGYNLSYNSITWGVSYSYSQSPGINANDQQFAISIQLPLSQWLPNSWASYNMNTIKRGSTTHQVGLSGTTLADNNLNYNLQQSYTRRGEGNSGNANASYKGTYGEIQGGYNYAKDADQLNYGLQGGIVLHPYGVTFSQQQGETLALVRAPGASGVKIENNTGLRTDWRGYAVVPYVSTYRQNRVALETESLAENVDLDGNVQTVVPTQGAVVLADFKTRVGRRVLMTLSYQGRPVPFGATAALRQDKDDSANSSIVGSDGQLYMSGVPDKGQLQVKWGNAANQHCQVNFALPGQDATTVTVADFVCR